MPHLFEPLSLRGVTLRHRIGVSPMCQYSAREGQPTDWHLAHYGGLARGGASLVMVEATAVQARGRITLGDMGLWDDAQIAPLARITAFVAEQGAVPGVQLAHAGRKASVAVAWRPQVALTPEQGGWPVIGPSAVPFNDQLAVPTAMTADDIAGVVRDFALATRRALAAGFRVVEVHAAHGYLLHQFLSPRSNQRTDEHGGSFDNRTRLVREVVSAVRATLPPELPLLVRLSATDWVKGGWTLAESVQLAAVLKGLGVDLVDTTSGGNEATARIPAGPGYQTPFAEAIRREAGLATAAVGLITEPAQADHIIRTGQADLVLLARELLRNPHWPLAAARALAQPMSWPAQYLRAGPHGSPEREPV